MADLSIQGEVVVNSEKAESAFDRVGDKASQMANEVATSAGKAGQAVDKIGDGADKGAEKFTRAEARMREAIKKSTRELEMMGKTASQKFEANLEFKGLDKAKFQPFLNELRQAEEATKRAETGISSMSATAQMAGRAMALAFSGAAITGFLGKVVAVQREFDVLNSSLKTVTGSSAAAEREMAWLKDFAKETPFGLAQATQGFVKMKALGLDPTRAALTSFGNTASAMGKDLNQMIDAVADASTGEFERLKEFGIKAKKEGDNVSLTFQGVTTTIGNSAREITKYLEDIGNTSFGGAMEERAKTLDGTIAALGDTWDELFRTVSTNNVGGLIFDSVTLANGALEDATTILRALGGAAQDAGRDTGALSTIQSGIATVFETVAVLGANLKFVLVGIGNEIGGLAAQVAQAAQFNFSGVAAIRRQMVADAEAARKEIDATTARILNARKAQEEYARYATRNASAATDPRRVDLGGSTPRATGGVSSGAAKAVKEVISEYDKLIKKLSEELPKAAAEAEAAQMGYNKSQTEFLALAGSPVWASFTNSERARVAAMYEGKIASEQSADAAKELSKAYAEAAAERIKTIQAMERAADGLQSQNDALREEIELIGLSTEQQTLVLQQRNDALILTKEATLAELERQSAITGTQTRVEIALASEIEALKERNALLGAKGVKNAAVDAAKTAKDEWQKTTDSINQTLTDSLMRGFESGKDMARNLRDTVVSMFKTMVLRPVISAIINPISQGITGMMGLSGAAQAGQGASALGGIGNIASLASGIGSFTTAGMLPGAMATALTGSTSSLAMGLSGAWGAGGGMLSTLNAGVSMLGQASTFMSGLGTLAGALGPIALGIAALAAIFGKKATPHAGAASTYSAETGLVSGADIYRASGLADTRTYNAGVEQVTGNVAKAIGDTLNATARTFGKEAGYEISTAFADDTSKDGAWGSLMIRRGGESVLDWRDTQTSKWAPKEFADGEAGSKEYLAAVAKSTREALDAMDLPGWADDMLNALGETPSLEGLASTVDAINAAGAALDTMGKNLVGFAGLTDEAISALVRASGGMAGLINNASTFYDNFYTDAEKADRVKRDITDRLSKLGINGIDFDDPKAREKYRKLVEDSLARSDEQAKARKALADGFLSAAGNGGMSLSDLAKGDGWAGLGIGGKDDPEARQRLDGMFADVNKMVTSGKSPAEIEASVASFFEMNAEVLGLGEDAAATTAALLEASAAFASVTQSAEQVRAEAQQDALSSLQRAVDAEKRLLDARISVVRDAVSDLSGVFDLLHTNVRELYGEVASTASMMAAQGQNFIAQALITARTTGYMPDEAQLSEAIGAARSGISATQYATQFESDRARLVLAGQLSELEEMAGEQLGTAERALRELQGQSDQLDLTLQYWRDQLELSQSGVDATLSVADAVAALQELMFPEAAASTPVAGAGASGGGSGGGITWGGDVAASKYQVPISIPGGTAYVGVGAEEEARADKLADLYRSYDGTGDLTGLLSSIKDAGGTLRDLSVLSGLFEKDWERAAASVGIPAFADGGLHSGGLRLVGERGWEVEATGPARIWNQQQIASAMGGGSAELIAEVRALRAEVAQLRATSAATASNTAQMADQFDNVSGGGNAVRMEAVA